MSAAIEQLEAKLGELRGKRAAAESVMTREDLGRGVGEWLAIARAHAAGACGWCSASGQR